VGNWLIAKVGKKIEKNYRSGAVSAAVLGSSGVRAELYPELHQVGEMTADRVRNTMMGRDHIVF
jgi:hypothetical protein